MARWRDFDNFRGYFPPSRPLAARGGIKAQSKRGEFAESWWGRRWIRVLESFHIGARLNRGRRYARQGQVLSVEVGKERVEARVQGSRPAPYRVAIQVKALPEAAWKKVTKALAAQPVLAARMLAGEMPPDIERVFEAAKVSLFPERLGDLTTECSCPDWSNPCKHVAAVYYLLGEEFDRDPFLIFRLRGMSREEFVGLLGATPVAGTAETPSPRQPLSSDPAVFWNGGAIPAETWAEAQALEVHAALPRRLGNFPFWRGEVRFLDAMESAYADASARALEVFLEH